MPRTRRLLLSAALATVIAGAVSAAAAEPISREDYVNRIEAICKPGSERTQRAMKGARQDVREERNAVAAAKFERGGKSFESTTTKIARVPRPEADAARLEAWFSRLDRQSQYMHEMASQLRSDHSIKAQRLLSRFIHNGNLSNNLLLAFELDYCSFKFSRYG